MTDITRALARFAVTTRYEALPEKIRHEGVRAFVNWVGCAAGGSQEDAIDRALGVVARHPVKARVNHGRYAWDRE